MMCVCGDGRGVHPSGIGKDDQEDNEKKELSRVINGALADIKEGEVIDREDINNEGDEQEEGEEEGEEEEGEEEIALLVKEMEWLRLEGSHREADIIHRQIMKMRKEQVERVRQRLVSPTCFIP